jgi:hypothetical protein
MIILQRLSYFIFAVFVSTLFVYLLHRTFTPNDIINIPVLAIIIYLIINYSAEITYEKNLEKFLNQQSDSSIPDMMENFDGAGSSLLKRLSAFSEEEEESQKQNQGDQYMNLPVGQIQTEEKNKMSVPAPKVFPQEEEMRQKENPAQPQEEEMRQKENPAQPQEEEMRQNVNEQYIPMKQNEGTIPMMMMNQEENIPQPLQEESKYYDIKVEKNPKEKQAKKKEYKRPNVNKYLENKSHEMTNKLYRSVQPININVSYNNPVALNKFNNPDTNKFRFDSGLDFGLGSGFGSGLGFGMGSGFDKDNGSCYNENDPDLNSKYYPSYLSNPLNKNVGGTQIPAIRQQSNYEQDRQKQILTEKNSPSPVMLGNGYSEWAPVNEE